MASVQVASPTPLPEDRTRMVEVIDVDLLSEEDIRASPMPFQRRRLGSGTPLMLSRSTVSNNSTPIFVDDSDDEQPVASGSSAAGRRRLFSPPPPVRSGSGAIPPVPPLPPMRRRPPPFPASSSRNASTGGPVRPNSQPFDFETILQPTAGPFTTPRGTPPRRVGPGSPGIRGFPDPVAPSHHVPAMGLGGAIISRTHPIITAEHEHERQRRRAVQVARARATSRAYTDAQHERGGGAGAESSNSTGRSLRAFRVFNLPSLTEAATGISSGIRRMSDAFNFNHYRNHMQQIRAELDAVARLFGVDDNEVAMNFAMEDIAAGGAGNPDLGMGMMGTGGHMWAEYRPEYTHPGKPAPGYTFDFGVGMSPPPSPKRKGKEREVINIDLPSASSSSNTASMRSTVDEEPTSILVCARCLDPLVIGGAVADADFEDDSLWALRCGHMLDGKCVRAIMRPFEAEPLGKGKGKARNVGEEVKEDDSIQATEATEAETQQVDTETIERGDTPAHFEDAEAQALDRNGKRKADVHDTYYQEDTESRTAPDTVIGDDSEVPAFNSIRSRLRSTVRPNASSSSFAADPDASTSRVASIDTSPARNTRSARARTRLAHHSKPNHSTAATPRSILKPSSERRSKRKRSRRTLETAKNEWACPVCKHPHLSVRVGDDGPWVMDAQRGAIGVYV